jgi:hypothetical protein
MILQNQYRNVDDKTLSEINRDKKQKAMSLTLKPDREL